MGVAIPSKTPEQIRYTKHYKSSQISRKRYQLQRITVCLASHDRVSDVRPFIHASNHVKSSLLLSNLVQICTFYANFSKIV